MACDKKDFQREGMPAISRSAMSRVRFSTSLLKVPSWHRNRRLTMRGLSTGTPI
jgi:hypothetical protein